VSVQLVSKISNLCDPDPPTLQTDRQTDGQTDGRTTCNLNTALCTSASRGKKNLLIGKCVFHTVMEADTRPKVRGLSPKPLIRAAYDSWGLFTVHKRLPNFPLNWHLHNAFSIGVLKHFAGIISEPIIAVYSSNDVTWRPPTLKC